MENRGDNVFITDIIDALNVLLTPSQSGQKCDASDEAVADPFLQQLQHNLERLNIRLLDKQFLSLSTALKERIVNSDIPGSTSRWECVNHILQLLHLLSQAVLKQQADDASEKPSSEAVVDKGNKPKRPQDAPPLRKSAMSVGQLSTVTTALQFVTALGICPHLTPGVGIPLQYRSQAVSLVPLDTASVADVTNSLEHNAARLSACVSVLAEMIQIQDLKSIILNEPFLMDILAALFQLLNGVGKLSQTLSVCLRQKEAQCESTQQDAPGVRETEKIAPGQLQASIDTSARSETVAGSCEKMLACIMSGANPVLLVRTVMLLMHGVSGEYQKKRCPGSPVVLPPTWLRKTCSHLLSSFSGAPQGIQHLYEAISTSAPDPSNSWRHCDVVTKILTEKYHVSKSRDQFVANVSKQMIDLLHLTGKEGDIYTQLVGRVVAAMTTKCDGFHHFHSRLLQPLRFCQVELKEKMNGSIVVSEEDLTKCLQHLHTVYVRGQQPLSDVLSALTPVMAVLWALFCVAQSGVCISKQWVKDVLVSYLKLLSRKEAAHFLHVQGEVTLAVRFEAGKQGGLQAVCCDSTCVEEQQHVAAVISILQELKREGVTGELLVVLLQEMTDVISKESQQGDIILPPSVLMSEVREKKTRELKRRTKLLHQIASICETFGAECLTDGTHILLFVKASLERCVAVCGGTADEETVAFETSTMSMTLALLSAVLADTFKMKAEDMNQHLDSMLPLLEVIGQRHPDEFIREMASDIRIAIATQGAVWSLIQQNVKGENSNRRHKTESADLEPEKKAAIHTKKRESSPPFTELSLKKEDLHPTKTSPPAKPLIEVLSEQTFSDSEEEKPSSAMKRTAPESCVEELASNITETSVIKDQKSLYPSQTDSPPSEQIVVHESSTTKTDTEDANHSVKPTPQDAVFKKSLHSKEKPGDSQLQTVFKELCDPLLPVRGHALIALAKLVQERDVETLSRKDVVQKVFEENLRHGDSYLYLAAINGMSALADCFPESLLPLLASEFAGFERSKVKQTVEHRLKVGEALMKATRNLGEMIPKYRDLLLRAILTGARDEDATVRASSVSNLAEVCSLLHFSIGPVLHEIVGCCKSLLETDEAVVRQAAALTLAKLLEGLGHDCFTVLESVLRELYQLLKKACALDPDDTVRLHANLALDSLEGITKDALFPKQTLQKKIQVLPDADTFR